MQRLNPDIDVCAQLIYATADDDGAKATKDLADGSEGGIKSERDAVTDGMARGDFPSVDEGQLECELKESTGNGPPCKEESERGLGMPGAKADEGRNHGKIPEDGGNVGDKEEAVAVEYAKAPGGEDEDANTREHHLDEVDREFAHSAVETGRDEIDQVRSK